jgi:predicted Fe-S protein YdhL (DUF1289 family)
MSTIEQPCIRKCCLNEADICMGCFRSFDDMLKWRASSAEEKRLMLEQAKKRKKEHIQSIEAKRR